VLCGAGLVAAGTALVRLAAPDTVTAIRWPSDGDGFGGWSGIDVAPDGTRFVAISDSGTATQGMLHRRDGRLAGVTAPRPDWLPPVAGDDPALQVRDAEGLAIAPDGTLHVSFEADHGVATFPAGAARGHRLPVAPAFRRFRHNYGLEALALAPDGALYALPERSRAAGRPFPLYRFARGRWSVPATLPRDPGWWVTGADFGRDGALYVLERRFLGLGFASRIRRLVPPLEGLLAAETVYRSPPGRHGNLEGIGIWRDAAGRLRAVMVSDDNFNAIQRTQIVEVVLPLAAGASGR
jgi:hypothetical protein